MVELCSLRLRYTRIRTVHLVLTRPSRVSRICVACQVCGLLCCLCQVVSKAFQVLSGTYLVGIFGLS